MRQDNVELQDFIFRADRTRPTSVEKEDLNKYYTSFGDQEWIDEDGNSRVGKDSDKIYAQSKPNEHGTVHYFVKANKYGKLYNPTGMYTEGQHKRFNKVLGAQEFQFRKVNLRVFELYTSFLKTKNTAWLNNAEREMN